METTPDMQYDLIIIGAGLSGIGVAAKYKEEFPTHNICLLEARSTMGGTWDLFRYPGIRSDSDMMTFAYSFNPWSKSKTLGDGHEILNYIKETADKYKLTDLIHYNQKVVSMDFMKGIWTVKTTSNSIYQGKFIVSATGYYNYDRGYKAEISGIENYTGKVIHPQFWPQGDNDQFKDKHVAIIGSGATAVTLAPNLAKLGTSKVSLIQRSPSYILSHSSTDKMADWIKYLLPSTWAYSIIRMRNILLSAIFYSVCRAFPNAMKKMLINLSVAIVGEKNRQHFTPNYGPWEQRLCIIPDNDLLNCVKDETVEMHTAKIVNFEGKDIQLQPIESEKKEYKLESVDYLITATGLELLPLGGIKICVDGVALHLPDSYTYKGVMLCDLPNFFSIQGSLNASWTLKLVLVAEYVCRVVKTTMYEKHASAVIPRVKGELKEAPFFEFSSGYLVRALNLLPKQASTDPYRGYHNYFLNLSILNWSKIDDGALEFVNYSDDGTQPQILTHPETSKKTD